MTQKTNLRTTWKSLRAQIPLARREEAAKKLVQFAKANMIPSNVLSFSSFGDEIDTQEINQWLIEQKALLLPRVEGSDLAIYLVEDLKDLLLSPLGILEPNPQRCIKIDPQMIHTALVPGLCFDESHHRLGYGKGHYDRLLKELSKCLFLGIGFQEQKTLQLPHDPWDVSLQGTLFF
ncbi:MAG: 5-formyltetrahydrofolate cyclo-ligase [Chlamydiales bacterium]|nr:5-formyltetrahydrofolate cyclo-ligase [Chlamydiales bacterium]